MTASIGNPLWGNWWYRCWAHAYISCSLCWQATMGLQDIAGIGPNKVAILRSFVLTVCASKYCLCFSVQASQLQSAGIATVEALAAVELDDQGRLAGVSFKLTRFKERAQVRRVGAGLLCCSWGMTSLSMCAARQALLGGAGKRKLEQAQGMLRWGRWMRLAGNDFFERDPHGLVCVPMWGPAAPASNKRSSTQPSRRSAKRKQAAAEDDQKAKRVRANAEDDDEDEEEPEHVTASRLKRSLSTRCVWFDFAAHIHTFNFPSLVCVQCIYRYSLSSRHNPGQEGLCVSTPSVTG